MRSSQSGKKATLKKFMLHKVAIIVAAIAVGGACMATDAIARGGGHGGSGGQFGGRLGGSHFDRMGGGHFLMSGGHLGGIGGDHFGGRAEHQRYGHYRGWGAPYGYWGAPYGYYGDSGYYDPSTVAPDEQPAYPTTAYPPRASEQPTYPTAAYPYVKPPRSSCSTQTYKVPSEAGAEASVNVVRC